MGKNKAQKNNGRSTNNNGQLQSVNNNGQTQAANNNGQLQGANNNGQLQGTNNNGQTSANNNGQSQTTNIFVAPVLMRQITEEEYQNLKRENLELQAKFLSITHNERLLQETIKNGKILEEEKKTLAEENEKLKEENKMLKEKIKELEEKNRISSEKIIKLENDIGKMQKDKEKFDAFVQLHECNTLVNKHFRIEYKIRFNPKRTEYIPNIGDIINDPPQKANDEDYYNFWEDFKRKYPRSDDSQFRKIYSDISNNRANSGAHANINYLTPEQFDKLIILAYPDEYKKNQTIYNEYRDWLFSFPTI